MWPELCTKICPPDKVEGIDYYYTVGNYTFRFHAAQGESYRYLSITPDFDGDYDTIVFCAEVEAVTPIPDKYIPDWVASVDDIATGIIAIRGNSYLTTLDVSGKSAEFVIFSTTNGISTRPGITKVRDDTGTYPVYSSKTGSALTADERPKGVMLLAKVTSDEWACVNPV